MKTLITLIISNLSNNNLIVARARLFPSYKGISYFRLVFTPEKNIKILKIKSQNQIKFFTVPFNKVTEFEFIKLLQLNLKLDTVYTILFKYTSYELGIQRYLLLGLGPHTPIPVRETPELNLDRLLYKHYLDKLEILMDMDRYNIAIANKDFSVIFLKEFILEETLKKVYPITQIPLSKGLLILGKTKQLFSTQILAVSNTDKNFGSLHFKLKIKIEYLTKLIEKIQSRSVSDKSSTQNSNTSYVLQHGVGQKSPIYSRINEVLFGGYELNYYYYYYNKDIDFSIYNSIPTEHWDLRTESLKYLSKDLNSLEIFGIFPYHL